MGFTVTLKSSLFFNSKIAENGSKQIQNLRDTSNILIHTYIVVVISYLCKRFFMKVSGFNFQNLAIIDSGQPVSDADTGVQTRSFGKSEVMLGDCPGELFHICSVLQDTSRGGYYVSVRNQGATANVKFDAIRCSMLE